MCDPVTIGIMLASTAGSSLLQNKAEQEAESARRKAINSTNQFVDERRDEAAGLYQQSLDATKRESMDSEAEAQTESRAQLYQDQTPSADLLPGQGDSSAAAKTAVVQAMGRAGEKNKNYARSRAKLDAYGDASLNRNITTARTGQGIAQQGNFAQGQVKNVLPLELEEASHAGDKYAMMGDVVKALGTVAGATAGGFASPAGEVTKVASSFESAIPGLSSNPGLGMYLGKGINDPLAAGLTKVRFNPALLYGGA